MFVVRYTTLSEEHDFKVFEKLPDARQYFETGSADVRNKDIRSATIFMIHVGTSPREAIEMVKLGLAEIIDQAPKPSAIPQKVIDCLKELAALRNKQDHASVQRRRELQTFVREHKNPNRFKF